MTAGSKAQPMAPCWDQVLLHDYFNLGAISFLNLCNFYYLYTGEGFSFFWTASLCYFLLDILYVGLYPRSIKSPVIILLHHVVTSLFLLIPYNYPEYESFMGYCMLVEINTLLLIARRNFASKILDVLFYASWVLLRNLWYPYLVYCFYCKWQEESQRVGTMWNLVILAPAFQLFFTGLNYMWTFNLLLRMLRPSKGSKGKGAVSQLVTRRERIQADVPKDAREKCL